MGVAHQAPLSMGFPRQEYQHGFPFPSPGDLPDPGTEPASPALQVDSLPIELPGKPIKCPEEKKKKRLQKHTRRKRTQDNKKSRCSYLYVRECVVLFWNWRKRRRIKVAKMSLRKR